MRRGPSGSSRTVAVVAPLAAVAAFAATSALAVGVDRPVSVDLNADGDQERLVPKAVRDRYGYRQRMVILEDRCPAGGVFRIDVLPPHDTITVMRPRELDGDPARPEVLLEGRSGASGLAGAARVLRYDDSPAGTGGCGGEPRILFAYSSTKPRPRPPRGWYVGGFAVRARDYDRSRDGREIRLWESLVRNSKPVLAASRQRISYFRYSPDRGRYVRYRTSIRPLR